MKTRLDALLALTTALGVAACGSHAPTAAPTAGSVATSPAPARMELSETGSTLLYPLFSEWGAAYHQKYPNVTITTQGSGSGAGISQVAAGAVTIGTSDAYLSEGDMAAHKGLMNIALAISAQQVNYNLPGIHQHLKLNGKVLAAMYQGAIKTWSDPRIGALNPGLRLPDTPVVPLHRSDGSGSTFQFTQYLSKQDPDGWGRSPGFGTTVDFPAVPGALGENGDGAMVTGCAANPGCVAYASIGSLDAADEQGLGEAKLGNASGKYLLPKAKTIQAAAGGFATTPANQAISLIDGPAADGYPIVNYEYAIISANQKDAATAQTLQAFLHWAVTDGNDDSFLDKIHFQPLPDSVVTLSVAQIAKISG
ncbi:phosphate ABC transporter substrate-binding protein PstS [Mycobacterium heidelbergense]|uniref:Phosphate-binding protein n=1 Tax=Mycobacterium heidelbergense TaxID=53376 RepID=A0A1X0DS07_MYCHE|nr:phosphate ABC transporter substrate-binding protein PstS [Mycobacterium heidelbergense]MCV7050748.1 phosphate ABC transporter substrate-binding protein PstS [Mycobacterium heidelbergense]ORA75145.1 phosphate ABC transporter substrate-binding protein PstS [Mycobacterium heidelbergense]BBZ49205.1 phosphate-binding protein PstS 1 [Mycobacterium heidelbergense]